MGAWIEIVISFLYISQPDVAPFVGAWIEIFGTRQVPLSVIVAPFVGAWIEIKGFVMRRVYPQRRSLCGSVD